MTTKDNLKDEILIAMSHHVDANTLSILRSVLETKMYDKKIENEETTLPATVDYTNQYIIEMYKIDRNIHLSEQTLKEYIITINDFLNHVHNKPLTQIETEDINYYLRQKRIQGNSNTSLNNKRRKLNTFFTWIVKKETIKRNPVDGVDGFKEQSKPIDYLSPVEVEKLKTGCKDKRDRALLEWLRCTAVRKGEIQHVNINDIDWVTGKVIIYGEKTSTFRTVMLDDIAIMYLTDYIINERKVTLNSNENLFTYCRGDISKPLGNAGIYALVKRIAKRSELPDSRRIYPHLFRKTTATNIVKRGGTVDDAGAYLGHKAEGVTGKHYVYMGDDYVQQVFKKCVQSV